MVPPYRRAYSQLKMKVLALPMWRNPVGEGAKRTLCIKMPVYQDGLWSFGEPF
jgi:hypothetical protein